MDACGLLIVYFPGQFVGCNMWRAVCGLLAALWELQWSSGALLSQAKPWAREPEAAMQVYCVWRVVLMGWDYVRHSSLVCRQLYFAARTRRTHAEYAEEQSSEDKCALEGAT